MDSVAALASVGSPLPLEDVGKEVDVAAVGLSLASLLEAARSAFALALINLLRAFSV